MKRMMFSKHLRSLPLERAAATVRGLGFEGLDLTLRPGGFVDPAQVKIQLPHAIQIAHDAGLEVPLATTAITSADEEHAAQVFEAARDVNIPDIKLGYVHYGAFGTFRQTLDQAARDLDGIERLAHATGVRANLHVHSGPYITAAAPVLWWLIKDRDPAAIGAYIDPGHMAVEGGGDTWRMGLDLLARRITLVAVKDFAWKQTPDEALGKPRWISQVVPLRQGIVPWPQVLACLQQLGFNGWFSVHSEYQGRSSWRDLSLEELLDQTRDDLAYLNDALTRASAQDVTR